MVVSLRARVAAPENVVTLLGLVGGAPAKGGGVGPLAFYNSSVFQLAGRSGSFLLSCFAGSSQAQGHVARAITNKRAAEDSISPTRADAASSFAAASQSPLHFPRPSAALRCA